MTNKRKAAAILDAIYNKDITMTDGREQLLTFDYALYAFLGGKGVFEVIDDNNVYWRYTVDTGTWNKNI